MKKTVFITAAGLLFSALLHAQPWDVNGNPGTVPGNYLGTTDLMPLNIATNGTVQVSVTTTGEVGIGNTTPTNKLQVYSPSSDLNMALGGFSPSLKFHDGYTAPAGNPSTLTLPYGKIGMATSTGDFVTTSIPGDFVIQNITDRKSIIFSSKYQLGTSGSGLEQMRLTSNGYLGIGTSTPAYILTVYNGTTTGSYTTAGWASSSDKRLKTDIQAITAPMEIVKKLNGVYYQFINNKDAGRQVGFIAQDVQKVLPEVVVGKEGDMSKGETLGMVYQNIVPVLVEALKEKDAQIDNLQQRLDRIEKSLGVSAVNTVADGLTLSQNTPNPFTNNTSISYTIPQSGNVLVELFNEKGLKVKTLENVNHDKGSYTIQITDSQLAPGTYIYTISVNGVNLSRKAIKL